VTIRTVCSIAPCLVAAAGVAFAQPGTRPTPPVPVDVAVVVDAQQTPASSRQPPTTLPTPTQPPKTQTPPTQPPTTLPTPTQAPKTQAPPTQAPTPVATPQVAPPRKIRGRDVNVQIELTITEHQGGVPGEKRVVSMIVADAAFGRIRSTASQDVKLNIDATPTLLDNDRIALELTIEYIPVTPEGAARRPAGLLEMLTVILQNGKPLQISQAADPTIDRRITAEVRASVMK
jgi:hypothetical protein